VRALFGAGRRAWSNCQFHELGPSAAAEAAAARGAPAAPSAAARWAACASSRAAPGRAGSRARAAASAGAPSGGCPTAAPSPPRAPPSPARARRPAPSVRPATGTRLQAAAGRRAGWSHPSHLPGTVMLRNRPGQARRAAAPRASGAAGCPRRRRRGARAPAGCPAARRRTGSRRPACAGPRCR